MRFDILILAHQGIEQPSVWQSWYGKADPNLVFLHFLTPRRTRVDGFVEQHRLRRKNGDPVYMKRTNWGSFSIVLETLTAMEVIMEHHCAPHGILFITSGSDIPIQHPSVLDDQYLRPLHPLIPNYMYVAALPDDFHAYSQFQHHQWMGLRYSYLREHILSKLRMDRMGTLYDCWQKCLYIYIHTQIPPDETWCGVITGHPLPPGYVLSTMVVFPPSSKSPVTWNDFTEEKHCYKSVFNIQPDKSQYFHCSTLQDLLQSVYINRTHGIPREFSLVNRYAIFFRKVAESVEIPSSFLDQLWSRLPARGPIPRELPIPFLTTLPRQQFVISRQEASRNARSLAVAHQTLQLLRNHPIRDSDFWKMLLRTTNMQQQEFVRLYRPYQRPGKEEHPQHDVPRQKTRSSIFFLDPSPTWQEARMVAFTPYREDP